MNLVYYGHQRQLEYDFVLQSGASPEAIRLGIQGANSLRLDNGDLVLTSAVGDVRLRSPHIYQEANGVRSDVHGGYVIKGKGEVGFEVAAYDRSHALVIDPVLAYSTFLGGDGFQKRQQHFRAAGRRKAIALLSRLPLRPSSTCRLGR